MRAATVEAPDLQQVKIKIFKQSSAVGKHQSRIQIEALNDANDKTEAFLNRLTTQQYQTTQVDFHVIIAEQS